ncbi:lactase/phlorizin hydrolase-like [Antedon mediterranea]|uniref:lactase/phlorizin hydrolase-like n=1 Tax=Antedon mediterranea TaxID=105859 RepID=UPI003AF80FED
MAWKGVVVILSLVIASISSQEEPEYVYPDVFNDPERDAFHYGTFPEGFAWSSATSSYQIEGAWDADGKGESIWDRFAHEGGHVYNNDTGDVACDSYNNIEEDVKMIKAMGLGYYRFSFSWPRILPDGTINNINAKGVEYYSNLIDALLVECITPMVTLYHWDLPQALQDVGGWANETIVDHFNDYADFCFKTFGTRVKFWITFNEPWIVSMLGYGAGSFAPGIVEPAITVYVVTHNIIKSHATSWHNYDDNYRSSQKGKIGITLNSDFFEPFTKSQADVDAAERGLQFQIGWFAHPIFKDGDYPQVMKENVAYKSAMQGYPKSRLPEFTDDEKEYIKGTTDFFGLNHYTSVYTINVTTDTTDGAYWTDQNIATWKDEAWPRSGSTWLQVVPWGIRRLLNWIDNEYDGIPIYVTENGVSTADVFEIDDVIRQKYYRSYINEVLKAIDIDGSNVKGYTAWSLMDNFEWASGYSERFGMHYVDFNDPNRKRTPKNSTIIYAKIVADNGFPKDDDTSDEEPEYVYPDVFNDPERDAFHYGTFPEGFAWSSATSSYQIEGAWDADGKGESIWDRFAHEGGHVYNNDTGDVACDSYNNIKEDVKMIKAMGLGYYRFSLSWPRILPDGTINNINAKGVEYYSNLIDALLVECITPMVTLYHWDLPQALQDVGGWANETIVDHFNDYADFCFKTFGTRVKFWLTFNEPWIVTLLGYGDGSFAPGIADPAITVYVVTHNIIKSHAAAWHTYDDNYRSSQKGQVGITLNSDFIEPADRSNPEDVAAADRCLQFQVGWFAHPIYVDGDYPQVMKEYIAEKSAMQNYTKSRLPEFTDEEKAYIKGTGDFFGLNHYSSVYAVNVVTNTDTGNYWTDQDIGSWKDESWPGSASSWLKVVPWGIRRLLKWIHDEYDGIPTYVTENGISTEDVFDLNDVSRQKYYRSYINEVLKAIDIDGSNVKGYTAWSLMDNFEWASGYSERFGMHYVDFNDPNRKRTPKESTIMYAKIVADNGFPKEDDTSDVGRFTGCITLVISAAIYSLLSHIMY